LPGIVFSIWSLALLVLIASKVKETFKRGLNDQ
jgi:hypothetical protein